MPRVTTIKTNFTAGEISPRLLARVDIARYANGAKVMENAYALVHGGARRRSGMRFVAATKNAAKIARLVSFIFSSEQAFMLEFGETYIRFFTGTGIVTQTPQAVTNITQANPAVLTYGGADTYANGDKVIVAGVSGMTQVNNREFTVANLNAGANTLELAGVNSTGYGAFTAGGTVAEIYEIASPWDDLDLADLHYVQGADTMFLAHPSFAIRTLVRFANTSWKLSAATFEVPPSEEIGERPATALTLSATSGGAVTATAAAASFQQADIGRFIDSGAGRGQITGFTSTTDVTLNIPVADAFASVGPIAAGAWTITESPKISVTASVAGPIGAAVTLTAAVAAWKNDAQVNHVGMFVELNDGLVQITGFTSTSIVSGIVRTALSSVVTAPSEGWALRQTVWNSIDGHPRAVSLYEQRLVAGGSPAFPDTVWGSRTGEYFNFADGVADNDGFAFVLASDQVNPIEHLASTRVLLPLTFGAEFSMTGGVEKPITPTNVQAKAQTVYGCDFVRPVRVANEIIFIQRGGKKVRALGYRADTDAFNAPDISILSEHITGDGILEMAYAQEPDQIVWMVRADGQLVSMSIDRDQDAIGFARHITDGEYESVACMPFEDSDQVWAVVARTINGQTVRYIERFEEGLQTDCCITGSVPEIAVTGIVWAAGVVTVTQNAHGYSTGNTIRLSGFTPAGYNSEYVITVTGANAYTFPLAADPGAATVLGTAAVASAIWSGFMHLEGETVDVVADSLVANQEIVSGGAITLDHPAYSVEIGLHYKTTIQTLAPEIGTGTGSAQGNAISIHEIIVRLYQSIGCKVGNENIPFRRFGESVMNQPITPFTGDKRVSKIGWGRTGSGDMDGTVTIEQDQPLPLQVLGVITRFTVNDG